MVGKFFTEMARKIVLQNARSLVTMMSASFKILKNDFWADGIRDLFN